MNRKVKMIREEELEGASNTKWLDGYNKKIKNKNIIYFSYTSSNYFVEVTKEKNNLHVISKGGNTINRDGTRFILDYKTDDLSFLVKLNDIIIQNDLCKNNGYTHHVNGLPEGLGGVLNVKYENSEQIYISDNQAPIMDEKVDQDIYELFHKLAKENNLDFTTNVSNVKIYDDADEEYLQGTWKGKHFGDSIKVSINKKEIKIFINEILTDNTNYAIYEGHVRKNKLKEGIKIPNSYYDYEEFKGLSTITKKNYFTLTAYFMKDSYSTCDLLKEQK